MLIRTGFSRCQGEERYGRSGPGFSPELARSLRRRFPWLGAIAPDCISLTSLQHREEGRRAHRAILGEGMRIFEELGLENVLGGAALVSVIALPLRCERGYGAPCSVIGLVR